MKNCRMFKVHYIGPTNKRQSRIRITDTRFKKSVILSKSYEFDETITQAIYFLNSRGIDIPYRSWDEISKDDFLLTENFTNQIKD